MASDQVRTSQIQVSRKFVPTAILEAQLDGRYGEYERLRRLQGGPGTAQQPSALSFFRLPDKEIRDKYVDCQGQLAAQGVWVRHRTIHTVATTSFPLVNDSAPKAEWQAKLRLGGDDTSSQMLIATGRENMKVVASLYLSGVSHSLIKETAVLATTRRTYVVQKPFGWDRVANGEGEIRVIVDGVSTAGGGDGGEERFWHGAGKVEMTASVSGGESDGEHDLLRRRELARLQGRVDEFVARNALVFPKEGVKGKLQAFFEWKEEQERERTPRAEGEA